LFDKEKQEGLVIRKAKMVMKLKIIIIFLLSIQFSFSNYIEELKRSANADSKDYILVFYLEMANCIKCYIEPYSIINNIVQDKSLEKYKIIGIIVCDRDIELKIFKKEQEWKYSMYRDDGNARKQLGAPYDSFITVINSNNKMIHLQTGNPEKNLSSIKKFLKK
jgi:hypothetical protein